MTDTELDEMGPIDYIVLEWPGRQPDGSAAPHLLALAESGIIRILDIAFIVKDDDGSVSAVEISELGEVSSSFADFDGASSGLLDEEEVADAGEALEPGTCAAVLVWENRWAAPFARAVRASGGQLVASGRIPVQALLASLDALEEATH